MMMGQHFSDQPLCSDLQPFLCCRNFLRCPSQPLAKRLHRTEPLAPLLLFALWTVKRGITHVVPPPAVGDYLDKCRISQAGLLKRLSAGLKH